MKPGWQRVKFGEVVRLGKDRCADPLAEGIERYVGLEHIEPGDLRIRSWGEVAEGTTFTSCFKPGQVLFGKRRAYQRKVAVADFSGVCSGDIYIFESADPRRLLPELLPFLCQTDAFFEYAVGTSAGSLSPRTNWTSLAEYEFALPPLEEQRRLHDLMNSMRAVFDAAVYLHESLRQVEAALLADQFPLKCRAQTSLLHEVADIKLGYKVSPVHRGERVTKPIITVAQLQDGWLDLTEVKEVTIPQQMVHAVRPAVGSLLITEGGNLDQLGRGAVWRGELTDCVFQNHVFALRPKLDIVLPEYLEGLMRSPFGRDFFIRHAKRTSNLATIDQRRVRLMPVPVVSIAQQEAWAQRYRSVRSSLVEAKNRERSALRMMQMPLTQVSTTA